MGAYSRLSKYCLIFFISDNSTILSVCTHVHLSLSLSYTHTEEACSEPNLKVTPKFALGSLRVKETLTDLTVNKSNRMQKVPELCYSPFKDTKTKVCMTYLIQPALVHTSDFACFLSTFDSDNC